MGSELGGGGEFSAGGEAAPGGGEAAPTEAPNFNEGATTELGEAASGDLGQSELPEPPFFAADGETSETGDVADGLTPSEGDAKEGELPSPAEFGGDTDVSDQSQVDRTTQAEPLDVEQGGEAANLRDGQNAETDGNQGGDTKGERAGSDATEQDTKQAGGSQDATKPDDAAATTQDDGMTESEVDAAANEGKIEEAAMVTETGSAANDEGTAEAAAEGKSDPDALAEQPAAENEQNDSLGPAAEVESSLEAEHYGRTEAEYEDLARDPDRGGQITEKSIQERHVALEIEQRDGLGKMTRDQQGADFVEEGNNQLWDVKAFNSNYPPEQGGFDLQTDAGKIDKELRLGENVMVDTRDMTQEHADALKAEGDRRGWGDRVKWWP